MAKTDFTMDAKDYIACYGVSGGIQAAMTNAAWALYNAIAESKGCKPVSEDEFFEYYGDGEAGGILRHEIEVDFENLGLEW